ncbi:hypothetical protein EST38_g14027, partial [Candolleomyces aberdarensis]
PPGTPAASAPPVIASRVGQPPPEPANAVFATTDEARFYSVTQGLRVGVFGAWNGMARYVVGVGSASYARFNSREAALRDYTAAYNSGSVRYL